MQARIVTKLPEGDRWLYEVKWDGYRAITVKTGDHVEIRSRNNKDLTAAYPTAASEVRKLKAQTAVIDGVIVAVDSSGRPSFQALQHRSARTDHQIVYYAFDVLHLDGEDRTRQPLERRRALLPRVLKASGVLCSLELPGTTAAVIKAVGDLGLEGVIAKRRDSKYEPGKSNGA